MIFDGVDFCGEHIGNIKRMKTSDKLSGEAIMINGLVGLTHMPAAEGYGAHVILEWKGGPLGDMVADAVIVALLQVPMSAGIYLLTDHSQLHLFLLLYKGLTLHACGFCYAVAR